MEPESSLPYSQAPAVEDIRVNKNWNVGRIIYVLYIASAVSSSQLILTTKFPQSVQWHYVTVIL